MAQHNQQKASIAIWEATKNLLRTGYQSLRYRLDGKDYRIRFHKERISELKNSIEHLEENRKARFRQIDWEHENDGQKAVQERTAWEEDNQPLFDKWNTEIKRHKAAIREMRQQPKQAIAVPPPVQAKVQPKRQKASPKQQQVKSQPDLADSRQEFEQRVKVDYPPENFYKDIQETIAVYKDRNAEGRELLLNSYLNSFREPNIKPGQHLYLQGVIQQIESIEGRRILTDQDIIEPTPNLSEYRDIVDRYISSTPTEKLELQNLLSNILSQTNLHSPEEVEQARRIQQEIQLQEARENGRRLETILQKRTLKRDR